MPLRPLATLSFAILLPTACGLPGRLAVGGTHDAIPPLPDFPNIRAIDGYPNPEMQASFDDACEKFAALPVPEGERPIFDVLALSSGGVNGAFGAGVLTGWTVSGNRPEFRIVTGVSVGALMAPFAFAGPEFDDRLESLFRRISPSDMHHEKSLLSAAIWDESLLDNRPLLKSIEKGVDMELLRAVAAGHAEGRRLYVGSTNLDIGHFCIWDLGAIASIGTKKALQLFRKVLAASASIPVVYPPTRFDAGELDELHVDGAVIRPLFFPQNVVDGYASAIKAGFDWKDVEVNMWVVHNGSLLPGRAQVNRSTLEIAARTVTMMSYTMVSEDILHLYLLTRAWRANFRFVTLDEGLELSVDHFTPDETDMLFRHGYQKAQSVDSWETEPPGFTINSDLTREGNGLPIATGTPAASESFEARLERIEAALTAIQQSLESMQPAGDK